MSNHRDSNNRLFLSYVSNLGKRLNDIQELLDRFFQDVYDRIEMMSLESENQQDEIRKLQERLDNIERQRPD